MTRNTVETKDPLCPYCYSGFIVEDETGILFCNVCHKEVTIRKFKEVIK